MASLFDRSAHRRGPGSAPATGNQDAGKQRPEAYGDAALSGWDPYIVAITGGIVTEGGPTGAAPGAPAESRELGLLDWLRKHGA